MKNNKKIFFKNRVKCFYTEPENYLSNRLKVENDDLEQEDEEEDEDQDPENPEDQGDLS